MTEYIKREAVLNDMPGIGRFGEEYDKGVIDCRDSVWRFPASDVVPVVWCKDCLAGLEDGYLCDGNGAMPAHQTFPHNFCSYGERRADE